LKVVEIENLMSTHPGVSETAVIGMPDEELGERICTYVTLKPGTRLTFEEVIAYLKGKGASVQQLPERIEFVDELPMTKVGKVDKKALRKAIKRG
jgi:non-ribosomal peptide synthetase component E (peptide arylation enzyme)